MNDENRDRDPLADACRTVYAQPQQLPDGLPLPKRGPPPPAMPPGAPARQLQELEHQMQEMGVVSAGVHRKVLADLNGATRQMLAKHGIETPPGATHSALLAIISRRLALVDFHGNDEPAP